MKRSHETDIYLISPQIRGSQTYIGSFSDRLSPVNEYFDRSPEISPLELRSFTFDTIHNSMPLQANSGSLVDQMPQLVTGYSREASADLITNLSQPDRSQEKEIFKHSDAQYPIQHQTTFNQDTPQPDCISTSDSTDSSPTTTASLTESCSTAETPGTSPDTPASIQSLTYPSLAMRAHSSGKPELRLATLDQINKVTPPMKKARNLKNLAVNTATGAPLGRAISTASLPLESSSSSSQSTQIMGPPPTPAPLRPLGPQRRKSGSLALRISTQSSVAEGAEQIQSMDVPPTPSLIRPASLRHFQSTPSLPIMTAGLPPVGGMKLPPLATNKSQIPVGFAEAPMETEEEEDHQDFAVPQSREEKPETYPDGPICIYDPHIYLYFEPTATVASDYDVIFNVASEVKNPFNNDSASPDTPRANGAAPLPLKADGSKPEYIHVPWEHNTDIVPDLLHLVNLVDEKVQQGKRVLIHCQCGVSRSASLIVAYGLFKNPSITVQEAYDAVKRRSKWIGPNMNLIMQLQEFRSGLVKHASNIPSLSISRTPRTKILYSDPKMAKLPNGSNHEHSESESAIPMTAPLQPDIARLRSQSLVVDSSDSRGPSSAPSGFPWPSDHKVVVSEPEKVEEPKITTIQPASAYVAPSGQLLPGPSARLQPQQNKDGLKIETTMPLIPSEQSARAFNFGNFGFGSPRNEMFSPKADTFGSKLPQHFRFDSLSSRLTIVTPSDEQFSEGTTEARNQLKSQLGLNTRSNWDLRSSARTQDAQPLPPRSRSIGPPSEHGGLEVPEALMSPRATEFLNPFGDVALSNVPDDDRDGEIPTPKPSMFDPRSPPQKGASPVVRNIYDVFQ